MKDYKRYEPFFNSWYVKRVIGKGNYSTVYEIERTEFGRVYRSAMKVISVPTDESEIKRLKLQDHSDDSIRNYLNSQVQEIINEYAMMIGLRGHSNIVSYEDHMIIPHDDGFGKYIIIRMELLTPLTSKLIENAFTEQDAVKLGMDLCKALKLCQRKNIIHRDIKPENIMVSDNGDYKLGDFGVARTIEKSTTGLSRKGTYAYMAPEVYRCQSYGASVDIYSLGLVLYSLLNNNRTPFLKPSPAVLSYSDKEAAIKRRITGDPIPRLHGVSNDLNNIILKACAFNPKSRYQSASEMYSELLKCYSKLSDNGFSPANLNSQPVEIDFAKFHHNSSSDSRTPEKKTGYKRTRSNRHPQKKLPAFSSVGDAKTIQVQSEPPTISMQRQENTSFEPIQKNDHNFKRARAYSSSGSQISGRDRKKKKIFKIALCCIIPVILLLTIGFLAIRSNAPLAGNDAEILSCDWDWGCRTPEKSEGLCNVNIIMIVENKSNKKISGIAFNAEFDGVTMENEKNNYGSDDGSPAPFYAEGVVNPGEKGVMYSTAYINYSGETRDDQPDVMEITDVFAYESSEDFIEPYGNLCNYNDQDGGTYDAKITNPNSRSIDNDSMVVTVRYADKENGIIDIGNTCAQNRLDTDIPAHCTEKLFDDVFDNPEFYEYASSPEDFYVYVIEGKYEGNTGKYYKAEYDNRYCKVTE